MSDLSGSREKAWLEYAVTAAVLLISAVSLWVAIGTEDANREMVAAASWPFLQLDSSNSDAEDKPHITLSVTNSGVGPAKIESFEVFWKGKAYPNSIYYLHACCGLDLSKYEKGIDLAKQTPIITGGVSGLVIRAGESRPFLSVRPGPDNIAMWNRLDRARFRTQFRICYCSVFDECWIGDLMDLHPTRVSKCPNPQIPYAE